MLRIFLICFLCATIHAITLCQGDSLHFLSLRDTIFLQIGPFGEKFLEHKLVPGQTLYAISKFYGLSLDELYYYNPGMRNVPPPAGTPVRIPVPNRAIMRYKTKEYSPWRYIPVYYVVKKGDTMFRISKFYFRMPLDTIRGRNDLVNENIKEGQMLHMGWMSIAGISAESRPEAPPMVVGARNQALRESYLKSYNEKYFIKNQGPAFWNKKSKELSDLYALHNEGKINSIMEVLNPMTGRIVYVKVIGRIPASGYELDIKVVLSPYAAGLLGAKDPRFFSKITYRK